MSAVRLIFRTTLRARWRAWLALAGFVAITGGATLAALAAGRRTDSAVPRMLATTNSPDLFVESGSVLGMADLAASEIAHLPGERDGGRAGLHRELQLGQHRLVP